MDDRMLTPEEVCEYLNVSQSTLNRIVLDGDLPMYKVRGSWPLFCQRRESLRCRMPKGHRGSRHKNTPNQEHKYQAQGVQIHTGDEGGLI